MQITIIMANGGRAWSPVSWAPIQVDRPEDLEASDKANPPPESQLLPLSLYINALRTMNYLIRERCPKAVSLGRTPSREGQRLVFHVPFLNSILTFTFTEMLLFNTVNWTQTPESRSRRYHKEQNNNCNHCSCVIDFAETNEVITIRVSIMLLIL